MGMRIRQIQTTTKRVKGKDVVVPLLDDKGQEQELWSIDVPREIEAEGFPPDLDLKDKAAIEAHIAKRLPELLAEAEARAAADLESEEEEE